MGYVPLWSVSLSWVEVRQLRFVVLCSVTLSYVQAVMLRSGAVSYGKLRFGSSGEASHVLLCHVGAVYGR